MSIESIIETKNWSDTASSGGTISGSAGSPNIVGVGTLFLTDCAVNSIIVFQDASGNRAMGQVLSIGDDLNLVLRNNLVNAVAGATFTVIQVADLTQCFFRADNSVIRAPVIGPVNFSPMGVKTPVSFLNEININEGVLIKSIFIRMPFQYTLADSYFTLNFGYLNSVGTFVSNITSIGEDGKFHIPIENIETPVNAFVPTPAGALTSWQIGVDLTNSLANLGSSYPADDFNTASVSQVDAPNVMNGQLLPITIGMRILHAAQALT